MSTYTNKEAQIAKFAKAMGHPARVAIISLLLKKVPVYVVILWKNYHYLKVQFHSI